jgi:two-component system, chemotaxis family, chemotaxis protein CheY
MKILIAEDDIISSLLLQKLLSPYGEVHTSRNGSETVEAFKMAHASQDPYDLICLDIMMPGMDGQAVLRAIRAFEGEQGFAVGTGVKIIMTTALNDASNVMGAFRDQCDAYIVKPIERAQLYGRIAELGLAA